MISPINDTFWIGPPIIQSPPPPSSSNQSESVTTTTLVINENSFNSNHNNGGSYPKRIIFHKIMGSITMVIIIASMIIVGGKRCTQPVAIESVARQLTGDSVQLRAYVSTYYYRLHLIHSIALVCSFLIIILSCIDLVPRRHGNDIKYAFHFITIFILFTISMVTFYGSFVSFTRPCMAPEGIECCSVRSSPILFSNYGEKKAITSVTANDTSMISVMILDLVAASIQLLVTIVYFRDVRNEAERCGYLSQVHNNGYIIR